MKIAMDIIFAFIISAMILAVIRKLWYTKSMFCNRCGNILKSGDCDFCLTNSNALREFEEQDE